MHFCYFNRLYNSSYKVNVLYRWPLLHNSRCISCCKIHHPHFFRERAISPTKPKISFSCNDFLYNHYSFSIDKAILRSQHPNVSTIVFWNPKRYFHTTYCYLDKEEPSSQVEVTVKDLKEKAKSNGSASSIVSTIPKKSLIVRIKEEIMHYYHGFKLLFIDARLSTRYIYRLMNGETLSRREHRQLIRTTGDLFRLVPFSVFVIVPFMEFLLPVALKLFPGMLPSTFETSNEKEAKMKKKLKVKLEMAKFLQETLDSMSIEAKGHYSQSAKEFVEFFEKTHRTGEQISNEEIMKFSKLFEDEITLDSLSRPQLTALCRLLEMQPFGTNNFLRFQLRMKLRTLAADDKIIQHEGVGSLAVWELQQACRARGMRAYGMSKIRLQMQLNQWLDLSLNEKVPPSLLLLSRTLFVPSDVPPEESLAATISTLPEEVVTHTKASIGTREGKIDNVTRFEIIKAEEKKIKEDEMEEKEERKRKEELAKKKDEPVLHEAASEDIAPDVLKAEISKILEVPSSQSFISELSSTKKALDREVLLDTAPVQVDQAPEISSKPQEDIEITAEDIDHVEEALEMIEIEKKSHFIEEKTFSEIKSELADYEEDIKDLKEVLEDAGGKDKSMRESKASKRLYGRVNKMIKKMEPLMAALNEEKETLRMQLEQEEKEDNELINIEEIVKHMEYLISAPDSSKLEMIKKVLEKMDDDFDGAVKAEDVLKVLRMLSEDHVSSMSSKLFEEIIETMTKEDEIEAKKLIEMHFPRLPPSTNSDTKNTPIDSEPSGEDLQKVLDLSSKDVTKPGKGAKISP